MVDCATTPISVLDENRNGHSDVHPIHKWMFTWNIEQTDHGTCIYLEKPERRGLSKEEARLLLSADGMTFSQDWMVPTCRHPISQTIDQYVDEDRHGDGYKANFSYAVTGSELAPLDRAQHDFAERLTDAAAHARYEPGADLDGFISLSIGFRLARAGDFASIEASGHRVTGRPGTQSFRTTPIYDSWFMHVPTGQLLRFDDLMQYADVAAEAQLHNGRAVMLERFSRIYVSASTEVERAEKTDLFARRISQATGLPPHEWRMSLYFGEPCAPAISITFDTNPVDANNNEYISIHSSLMSWKMFMKPQYRDAIPLVD